MSEKRFKVSKTTKYCHCQEKTRNVSYKESAFWQIHYDPTKVIENWEKAMRLLKEGQLQGVWKISVPHSKANDKSVPIFFFCRNDSTVAKVGENVLHHMKHSKQDCNSGYQKKIYCKSSYLKKIIASVRY
jgi:hypothetical protein